MLCSFSLFAQHFHHKQKSMKHFSCQQRFHCSLWFYSHLIALLNTHTPTHFLLSSSALCDFGLSEKYTLYSSDSPKNRNSLIKVKERSQLPSQKRSHIYEALAQLAPTSPACQIFPFGSCVYHTHRWAWWVILLFDGIITADTPSFHSRSHICKEKKIRKFSKHQWKPKVAEVTRRKLDMSNEWLPGKITKGLRTGAGNKRQISLLRSRSCLHVCPVHRPYQHCHTRG